MLRRSGSTMKDHPRSCGEHSSPNSNIFELKGSSPLVRGAPLLSALFSICLRIIPARAGSTSPHSRGRTQFRDHPRSCGEHPVVLHKDTDYTGSSPLVRGALCKIRVVNGISGIIPARAGSTIRDLNVARGTWDHPRSCGEHFSSGLKVPVDAGSSPLVRGAPAAPWNLSPERGIIPARAGSTPWTCRRSRQAGDHPRSCGEHPEGEAANYFKEGSSPLVRGAPDVLKPNLVIVRIIPARAGSTRARSRRPWSRWDHPRSCGEHRPTSASTSSGIGSSPLVRGALQRRAGCAADGRIIPARAGSTQA